MKEWTGCEKVLLILNKGETMVKTYVLDVSKLPDPKECPEVLFGLEEKRKEKIQRSRQEKDRKQSLGAGVLLKKCLEERGCSVSDIRYNEHEKPEVDGCFFNLSHSHDKVVCVTGDAPVGCDIEKKGRYREGIAERFFTDNEVGYLNQFERDRKRDEFLRLWTMKESYLKMTGEGLQLALDRIEFEFKEKVNVYRDRELCDCNIIEYEIDGYILTVCTEDNEFEEKMIEVK